jgi:DNA-binding response OmpR family regulator
MSMSAELRRALVVEDEMMVAMYVEDLLVELGFEVAGIATGLDQAMPLARDGDFDFAVLDINLDGRLSFPIADVLRERGIPFLFASGYGSKGVSDGYRDAVRIQKPFLSNDLAQAIAQIAQ